MIVHEKQPRASHASKAGKSLPEPLADGPSTPKAIRLFSGMLSQDNHSVRRAALRALSSCNEKGIEIGPALPAIERLLPRKDGSAREAALLLRDYALKTYKVDVSPKWGELALAASLPENVPAMRTAYPPPAPAFPSIEIPKPVKAIPLPFEGSQGVISPPYTSVLRLAHSEIVFLPATADAREHVPVSKGYLRYLEARAACALESAIQGDVISLPLWKEKRKFRIPKIPDSARESAAAIARRSISAARRAAKYAACAAGLILATVTQATNAGIPLPSAPRLEFRPVQLQSLFLQPPRPDPLLGLLSLVNEEKKESPSQYVRYAEQSAKRHGIDPELVKAVIKAESDWVLGARSRKGAIGLMQLMPGTAEDLGVDPYDPRQNIDGGSKYLSRLLRRFGNVEHALVAYNWGEKNAEKYANGDTELVDETAEYLGRIRRHYPF